MALNYPSSPRRRPRAIPVGTGTEAKASPVVVPLFFTQLPNNYTPGIPEFLPGMLSARRRGHDVYLIQRGTPGGTAKERQTIGYLTGYERIDAYRLTYLFLMPCFRRQGVGKAILQRVQSSRGFISCTVPERNLGAQQLLKAVGFRCLKVIKDPKNREADSWYFFQWENPLTVELDITPPNFDLLPDPDDAELFEAEVVSEGAPEGDANDDDAS